MLPENSPMSALAGIVWHVTKPCHYDTLLAELGHVARARARGTCTCAKITSLYTLFLFWQRLVTCRGACARPSTHRYSCTGTTPYVKLSTHIFLQIKVRQLHGQQPQLTCQGTWVAVCQVTIIIIADSKPVPARGVFAWAPSHAP
jgi:hypothetical protein